MNTVKIGAITIGQSPRVDMTGDMLSRFPDDLELAEYGALDQYSRQEIEANFFPKPGDEVLVSRMRDGSQVKFSGACVNPLLQDCIRRAEQDGAAAIILLCTGSFPEFEHTVPLIRPQPLFHSVAQKLADGRKIAVMVPEPDQVEQAVEWWSKSGVEAVVTSASPYGNVENIVEAAAKLKNSGAAFLCLDCMGFTSEMKQVAGEASGLPVLLPRTLVASVTAEFLSFKSVRKDGSR